MRLLIILDNIRSTHNVGSIFRTAECLGVERLYLTGITPYPKSKDDDRLPHVSDKLDRQINKTALGATKTLQWKYVQRTHDLINELKNDGWIITALEQTSRSIDLINYQPKPKTALIVGNEVLGVGDELRSQASDFVEIPMRGKKESLNVVQAMAIATFSILNR